MILQCKCRAVFPTVGNEDLGISMVCNIYVGPQALSSWSCKILVAVLCEPSSCDQTVPLLVISLEYETNQGHQGQGGH